MESYRAQMEIRTQMFTPTRICLCLIVIVGCVLHFAGQILSAGSYDFGWYDTFSETGTATEISAEGGSIAICYNDDISDPQWLTKTEDWLDDAYASGLKVFVGVPRPWVDAQNTTAITSYINLFKNHGAVTGWYLYDEPEGGDLPACQAAYNAIKATGDTKPVSIVFDDYVNIEHYFVGAYDLMLADNYPCHVGDGEFEGQLWDTFRTFTTRLGNSSKTLGIPLMTVLQGLGRSGHDPRFRYPTFNEARYMLYYGIDNNATSTVFWARYRGIRGAGMPGDPYPYCGFKWTEDVFRTLSNEMATIGSAVVAGELDGSVSDNTADVYTNVYQDPDTHKYYLTAINYADGSESTTFTLDLPGREWTYATPLFEGSQSDVSINNGQFSGTFSGYQVHVYELQKSSTRNDTFESYSTTTTWNPSFESEGWEVSTPPSGTSHQIATGSNGNNTHVYKAVSTGTTVQNLLAYWDKTIPDADADVTTTSIEWQMIAGYGTSGDQYRIEISRQEDADYNYAWNCEFSNNFEGDNTIAGTMFVTVDGDAHTYDSVAIPGGSSWSDNVWYILEVEEDNENQRSRARLGLVGGAMGDWSSWLSHWAGLDMDEGQIRLMTNGACEYDNLYMVSSNNAPAGSMAMMPMASDIQVPEPVTMVILGVGSLLLIRRTN